MPTTLTHTQVRSVQPGPLFRIVETVTAAVGIATQVFVFNVSDDKFNRVAHVDDMADLPITKAAAILAGKDYYRQAAAQVDYTTVETAQDAAATFTERLKQLLVDYNAAINAFSGTTSATLSS